MTVEVLREALWEWLAYALDTTVYRADQNGPDRYPDECATYKIISQRIAHGADYSKRQASEDGKINKQVAFFGEMTVSVNFYGARGVELGRLLHLSRFDWQARQKLAAIPAAVTRVSGVRDLTYLGDTGHRPRYQCDVTLNFTASGTVENYRVDSVSACGEIDGDNVMIEIDSGREVEPPHETEG